MEAQFKGQASSHDVPSYHWEVDPSLIPDYMSGLNRSLCSICKELCNRLMLQNHASWEERCGQLRTGQKCPGDWEFALRPKEDYYSLRRGDCEMCFFLAPAIIQLEEHIDGGDSSNGYFVRVDQVDGKYRRRARARGCAYAFDVYGRLPGISIPHARFYVIRDDISDIVPEADYEVKSGWPRVKDETNGSNTRYDRSFAFLKAAMEDCAEHALCAQPSNYVPSRVIDVQESVSGMIYLRDTSEHQVDRYIALSHCWGRTKSPKTTLKDLELFKKGMRLRDLHKNFQDAVEITRRLNFRYIWIDYLCIAQADRHDWEFEADRMSDLYTNAQLVITAEDSWNSHVGILRPRAIRLAKSAMISTSLYLFREDPESTTTKFLRSACILDSRGWTLQEQYLARAVARFCQGRITYACKEYSYWERNPPVRPHSRTEPPEGFTWQDTVQGYTLRKLTQMSDRLVAIAGLARDYSREHGQAGRYLAGLWEGDLERQLCWLVEAENLKACPRDLRAPTWSWAYTDSGIDWDHSTDRRVRMRQDCCIDWENTNTNAGDSFARSVVSGQLKMEVWLQLARPAGDEVRTYFDHWDAHGEDPSLLCYARIATWSEFEDDPDTHTHSTPYYYTHFMILKQNKELTFRRIGIVRVRHNVQDSDGPGRRETVIVV